MEVNNLKRSIQFLRGLLCTNTSLQLLILNSQAFNYFRKEKQASKPIKPVVKLVKIVPVALYLVVLGKNKFTTPYHPAKRRLLGDGIAYV